MEAAVALLIEGKVKMDPEPADSKDEGKEWEEPAEAEDAIDTSGIIG